MKLQHRPLDAISTARNHVGKRAQTGKAMPWLLAALVLLGGVGVWWWKLRTADPAPATATPASPVPGGGGGARRFGGANSAQPVSVQTVRQQDIRVSVSAIGSIAASNTAIVRAQVSGVLQSLNFEEGQQVQAGQTLAQIDPRPFQASLSQVEGVLARDKAQLDGARVDLARYRDLLAQDAVPKQQLDTQEALVRQLEGTAKADQGSVDSARLQLSYTRVTAPIAGRVGLKQADLGNVIQSGDVNGIVSVTQTRPIALVFSVPAIHVPQIAARLRANQPLPVEAWDRSGSRQLAVGRVATIDNAIDASTDTIKVKAMFANTDDALFPNQAVSVRLQLDTLFKVLAVPSAAMLRGAQGFYLYVVNADNSVSTRLVKPGAVDGDWMAVEGPLQPGEKVVVDGVDRLRDGAKVEVIAADPKQRAGASPGRRAAASAAPSGASGTRGANRPSTAASPATDSAAGERPAWMDRLPPEVVEKLMKLTPDERREWIQKRREERDKAGSNGRPGSAPN